MKLSEVGYLPSVCPSTPTWYRPVSAEVVLTAPPEAKFPQMAGDATDRRQNTSDLTEVSSPDCTRDAS